jgi:DNA repair protein RadA
MFSFLTYYKSKSKLLPIKLAQEIEKIQDLEGVGPVTAGKLIDAGYDSVEALAVAPVRELMDKAGLESGTAIKIVKAARQTIQLDFVTAKQLWDHRQEMLRLTFGSNNLNKLLGGGLETQAITEFVGEFGSGKSQICMQLSITARTPIAYGLCAQCHRAVRPPLVIKDLFGED